MKSPPRFLAALLSICVFSSIASPSFAMISVGVLTKEKAKEKYGITMHARKNGDAGIKVISILPAPAHHGEFGSRNIDPKDST